MTFQEMLRLFAATEPPPPPGGGAVGGGGGSSLRASGSGAHGVYGAHGAHGAHGVGYSSSLRASGGATPMMGSPRGEHPETPVARRTTGGGDYDLGIAERRVKAAAGELLAIGDSYKPSRRTIAFLGDIFHWDNPAGTTTAGTPLERDGRLQKMIEVACESLIGIIEQ